MNRLNRKVEYALMALRHMSSKRPGELTTAKEVAEAFRTPFDVTARVMQLMASRGLLKSEQGSAGGYQIVRDLAKVNVLEVIEIVEGPQGLVKCAQHGGDSCDIQNTCNVVSPLSFLHHRLQDFYRSISLKELLIDQAAPKATRRRSEAVNAEGTHV